MARLKTLLGYTVEQHTSPNRGGRMDGHRGVVLHIAEGTYRGTISWQMNPNQRYASGGTVTTCSTFIVGRERGEVAQMVDTNEIAWCQRSGSRTWCSIELAGYAPGAPTDWQVEACAGIFAWLAGLCGFPVANADHLGERGLGHHSMDREWLGEEWGHDSCPGSGVIAAKSAIVARARQIINGEDDDMDAKQFLAILTDPDVARQMRALPWQYVGGGIPQGMSTLGVLNEIVTRARAGADDVDEQAVIDGVLAGLAGLDLDAAATALKAAFGPRAVELAARLAG